VSVTDWGGTRNAMNSTAGAWVSINNWYDHNRDGKVAQADLDLVYANRVTS
jgi:hypothetical protein